MFHPHKPAAALVAALLLCASTAAHAATTLHPAALEAQAEGSIHQSVLHQSIDAGSKNGAQVIEQRNLLLTHDLITAEATIPAGTRINSHLVAISGADAGSIAFRTPVLAVIADEQALASTSPDLGKATFNYASLSDFALAEKASFTTSGKALNYQLNGAADGPVIVRVITAAVPEPGTWAMFIAGFGLIGAQLRRRARLTRAATQ
jgi:hypothetical protein